MRGLQKSKRVSWASDVNLCQVRLFLSEESPSLVGLGAQDHLQAKASWPSYSTGGSDDNLPPGFEGTDPANLLKNKLSQIPLIKWRCPHSFVLDFEWQVVAGEESKEVDTQNQREMRVLEAVYPRPSAIPPNPLLMGIEDSYHHDQHTPLIPITPIEDEDASFDDGAPNTLPMSVQPPQVLAPGTSASQCSATYDLNPPTNAIPAAGIALGVEPNVITAAYAALSAVMTNNDQGNLIDPDLLVKILSDPNLIERLATTHGATTNPQTIPNTRSSEAVPSGPFYSPSSRVGPVPNLLPLPPPPPPPEVMVSAPHPPPVVAKDLNYYKSLIQQHGGEKQETPPQFGSRHNHHHHHLGGPNQEPINNPTPRDSKPKIMKPCIYFNSSRGCRHGANCAYQHDVSSLQRVSSSSSSSSSMQEVQQGAKRMKMDREITGT